MKLLSVLITGFLLFSSCNLRNTKSNASEDTTHRVKVKEVIQTSAYTYLLVKENDQDYWMAVNKMDVEVGTELNYSDAMEMKDFRSKELDRVFDRILFIQNISDGTQVAKSNVHGSSPHSDRKNISPKANIQVEVAPGGISIGELYKNRVKYADKKVIVRGQVVKVNNGIMNLNWVHLQDGTSDSNNFDLTLTTQEVVNLNDIVTFEGTVILNKDFGSGYSYELIIEGATLK